MIDFDFLINGMDISLCTGHDDVEMFMYLTAPMERQLTPKEVGVKITLEDSWVDRAEHMWLIEGFTTDDLYTFAVENDYHEYDVIDWGNGCLTSEFASQYEYLTKYVKVDEVFQFVEEWLTKNIDIR